MWSVDFHIMVRALFRKRGMAAATLGDEDDEAAAV